MDRIHRLVEQSDAPVTVRSLVADLQRLGVEAGSTVLVHSSLSSLGWVCGGAQAVIEALEEVIRPYGTLVMPTHTGHLSDPESWSAPAVPESWWEEIRENMPVYDPECTPSAGMGTIPEAFRSRPGVLRSRHPHFSFAASGADAIDIITDHQLPYGLGEGSPLARLYEADARVLLLGVGFDRNTSFHLAEYRSDYRTKKVVTRHGPVMIEGHRRWHAFEDIAVDSDDFGELGAAFHKHRDDQLRTGRVGDARALLFPQRACVDYAVTWLHRHRT